MFMTLQCTSIYITLQEKQKYQSCVKSYLNDVSVLFPKLHSFCTSIAFESLSSNSLGRAVFSGLVSLVDILHWHPFERCGLY